MGRCNLYKDYYDEDSRHAKNCTLEQAKQMNCKWSRDLTPDPNYGSCDVVERGKSALKESSETKARRLANKAYYQ